MGKDEEQRPPWMEDRIQFWSLVYIHAPRAKVFEYLTKGEFTRQFYLGMPISDPLAAAEKMWFGPGEEKALIVGRVIEFMPPERFAHTFNFTGSKDSESLVEFTLTEEGPNLSSLLLIHSGFASYDIQAYQDICSGWPIILSGLKTLLETGKPIQWSNQS